MKQNLIQQTTVLFCRTLLTCGLGLWGLQPLVAAEVERLRTEAIKNPVGIDVKHPAFSWTLEAGDERGISQKAYEINVFTDAAHTRKIWSSGRMTSDQQIDIPYKGDALAPSTRYYWTVTVWDNKGRKATSKENAYFETGLLDTGWNGARWIKTPTTEPPKPTASHYTVEMDFEIERQAAGIIFSASDKNNLFLWSIDVRDKKTPFLRRHIKRTANSVTQIRNSEQPLPTRS